MTRGKAIRPVRRRLTLMAEVQCWAIWDMEMRDNVDPYTLPISRQLSEEINQWSDRLDAIYKLDHVLAHLCARRIVAFAKPYTKVDLKSFEKI